jgi:hypothetical protein
MNKLTTHNSQLSTLQESTVLAACRDALGAQANFALKALIAGQLLIEYRWQLLDRGHLVHRGLGVSNVWYKGNKSPDDKFYVWIESHGFSLTTAKRWMEVASRVSRRALGLRLDDELSPVIDVESSLEHPASSIALSLALTADEKSLPPKALQYRQGVLAFMEDKTLSEALRACMDGESEAKRVTLAAGGKASGGSRGEDRKDFPRFIAKNLLSFSGNLRGWEKWRANHPAQHAAVAGVLRTFLVTGGQVVSHREGHKTDVSAWPLSFCELLQSLLKERLRSDRSANR